MFAASRRSTLLALLLLLAPAPLLAASIVNPGFETGDFTGWTLSEDSGTADFGTWGVLTDGTTVANGDSIFDHNDGLNVTQNSPGLPLTFNASEGTNLAVQLQRGPENHRMFQDVTLAATDSVLSWDMFYQNNSVGGFDPVRQYLAVHIRDVATDVILATVFKTGAAAPLALGGMTSFTADVSAFAGMTVRLDVEVAVQNFWFDAAFDNFQITVPEPVALATLAFVPLAALALVPPAASATRRRSRRRA